MQPIKPRKSPRHGIPFAAYPTRKGLDYRATPGQVYTNDGNSRRPADDYGCVLDSVLEMARDVADANGWTPARAVDSVLSAERWRILPTHRDDILARLSK